MSQPSQTPKTSTSRRNLLNFLHPSVVIGFVAGLAVGAGVTVGTRPQDDDLNLLSTTVSDAHDPDKTATVVNGLVADINASGPEVTEVNIGYGHPDALLDGYEERGSVFNPAVSAISPEADAVLVVAAQSSRPGGIQAVQLRDSSNTPVAQTNLSTSAAATGSVLGDADSGFALSRASLTESSMAHSVVDLSSVLSDPEPFSAVGKDTTYSVIAISDTEAGELTTPLGEVRIESSALAAGSNTPGHRIEIELR